VMWRGMSSRAAASPVTRWGRQGEVMLELVMMSLVGAGLDKGGLGVGGKGSGIKKTSGGAGGGSEGCWAGTVGEVRQREGDSVMKMGRAREGRKGHWRYSLVCGGGLDVPVGAGAA
jgi:hypothetical protein